MTETYTCIRCGYSTNRKSDFKRHILKKKICKSRKSEVPHDKLKYIYIDTFPEFADNYISKTDNTTCEFCSREFSCYSSKWRHIKRCKENNKIINELKERIIKLENKELESNQLINTNNGNIVNGNMTINNNNNNTTVNNNIEIVQLGNENICDILSHREQMKILESGYSSPNLLVKHVHFNDNYPQFKSFKITNLQNTLAHMYNSNKKDFIVVSKDELLTDLIDYKANDLHDMYNSNKHLLSDKSQLTMKNVITMLNSHSEFFDSKKSELIKLIYNESKYKKLN